MRRQPRVIACGGGAGGLELVVLLAPRGDLEVVLVDIRSTHMWMPLLHEMVSGALESSNNEVSYPALAMHYKFTFAQGALENVDRVIRVIEVGAVKDEAGEVLIQNRRISFDLAVIAITGVSNDFGVSGAQTNAMMLDTPEDAEAIRARIVKACMLANFAAQASRRDKLRIIIVGGGATGVELAAELRSTTRTLISYGLDQRDPDDFIDNTVLNADARVLVQLSEHISNAGSTSNIVRLVCRNSGDNQSLERRTSAAQDQAALRAEPERNSAFQPRVGDDPTGG